MSECKGCCLCITSVATGEVFKIEQGKIAGVEVKIAIKASDPDLEKVEATDYIADFDLTDESTYKTVGCEKFDEARQTDSEVLRDDYCDEGVDVTVTEFYYNGVLKNTAITDANGVHVMSGNQIKGNCGAQSKPSFDYGWCYMDGTGLAAIEKKAYIKTVPDSAGGNPTITGHKAGDHSAIDIELLFECCK